MEERTEQKKALPEPTELQFTEFTPEDVAGLRDYYHLRPNRSCDNSPLDTYLWQEYYDIRRIYGYLCLLPHLTEYHVI